MGLNLTVVLSWCMCGLYSPGSNVGLYAANCTEWLLVEAACFSQSMITVPLYDTLGPDVVEYICNVRADLAYMFPLSPIGYSYL